ncbi:MAG: tRNA (adenosine(37)-N6)-dimethylallyltransferase MiaA [Salinisphaeraceae bacterium]|nr:tRNA (adenosine(37)-N6)-dimethylallyltransferase MiaA [Salinisphaeraceae bacterium]
MTAAAKPVVFLMGPTASGKTGLAVDLVERFPCEIVSVDSALIYQGMDIGTAKPDAETLARAPHRLIDILDPAESYSAARFAADARKEIASIHANGRIPLLVGGTMLYFRALQKGLSRMPSADAALREQISRQAEAEGWAALHQRLAAADPAAAERIHPNDTQRIQRALEILALTGAGPSAWHQQGREAEFPWPVLKLALSGGERIDLRKRIEVRFKQMMQQGFLEEVQALKARADLSLDSPSLRCVGYRQLWLHLQGEYDLPTAEQRGITASHQLAKRRMTWLRSESDLHWLDAGGELDRLACYQLLEEKIKGSIRFI